MSTSNTNFRSTAGILMAVGFILLIPLMAMQFTDEVVWDLTDFAIAGALLTGTGFAYSLAAKRGGNLVYRIAVGIALAGALMLVWMNLAVGIIGTPDNPANLMYVAVLGVGIIGAILSRFQAKGMSVTLFLTSFAQALAAVIASMAKLGDPVNGPKEIIILNGFFVALWGGAGWLFKNAAAEKTAAL